MKKIDDLLTYLQGVRKHSPEIIAFELWNGAITLTFPTLCTFAPLFEFKQSAEAFFRALVLNLCDDVFLNDGGKRKNVGKVGVMTISNFDSYYFWNWFNTLCHYLLEKKWFYNKHKALFKQKWTPLYIDDILKRSCKALKKC